MIKMKTINPKSIGLALIITASAAASAAAGYSGPPIGPSINGGSYRSSWCESYHQSGYALNCIGIAGETSGKLIRFAPISAWGGRMDWIGDKSAAASAAVACSNTYYMKGLRGYSDAAGVNSLAISCMDVPGNIYEPTTFIGTKTGTYKSARCGTQDVADGAYGSFSTSRVTQAGAICLRVGLLAGR